MNSSASFKNLKEGNKNKNLKMEERKYNDNKNNGGVITELQGVAKGFHRCYTLVRRHSIPTFRIIFIFMSR